MSTLKPWQIWWADLDPTEGREQAGRRPVLIVSSPLHLALTRGQLVHVAPITNRERAGWLHRIPVDTPAVKGWIITEQIRCVSTRRLLGTHPAASLTADAAADAQRAIGRMFA